jgi:hypothetical protein
MTRTKLQLRVIGATRSAGATEEIIALVEFAFGACTTGRPGRPRKRHNRRGSSQPSPTALQALAVSASSISSDRRSQVAAAGYLRSLSCANLGAFV